jgi:hypothetical protein
MKKILASITIGALVLTGCSNLHEWGSLEQRDDAFATYACQRMTEEEASLVASSVSSESFDMGLTANDRSALIRHSLLVTSGTIAATCDTTSPDYNQHFEEAWRRVMEDREGDDFTPQVARDHGLEVD